MTRPGYAGVTLPDETIDMLDEVVKAVKEETGIDLSYPGAIKYIAKTLLEHRAANQIAKVIDND